MANRVVEREYNLNIMKEEVKGLWHGEQSSDGWLSIYMNVHSKELTENEQYDHIEMMLQSILKDNRLWLPLYLLFCEHIG